MGTATKKDRVVTYLGGLNVSWLTVAFFAVAIAYADGFWMTSLQGTIGAVERNAPAFQRWLQDSTLMLPVFLIAVLGAVILSRRWIRPSKPMWLRVGVAAFLVVGLTAVVATGEAAVSSAYDYSLQSKHIDLMFSTHHEVVPGAVVPEVTASCDALCVAKHQTMVVHAKSVLIYSALAAITNLILVAWLLAVRGGQLWITKKPKPTRAPESLAAPAMA